MNIQKMHIEVNLSLQKIASNVKRNFYPEEIDWVLNKVIGRFVKSKIKPDEQMKEEGFQSDEIDLNALRTLLELDYPLAVYKKTASDPFVLAELPANYSYLAEDYSDVVRNCHDNYTAASTFSSGNEYAYYLKMVKSTKESKPFYGSTVLTVNGVNTLSGDVFPTNMQSRDMLFVIEDIMKNELLGKTTPYRVYWERYKNIYKPETFIFVSPTTMSGVTLAFDSQTLSATTETLPQYKSTVSTGKARKENRLIRTDKVGKLQQSAFAKSQWESPISQVQGNTLKVYHDNTFIVSNLSINFIRKPRLVSLSLGQGCDLPEEFHPDICDLAVEYIKQAIGDPNYQWKIQDNQMRRE